MLGKLGCYNVELLGKISYSIEVGSSGTANQLIVYNGRILVYGIGKIEKVGCGLREGKG